MIPMAKPKMEEDEIEAVKEVMESGYLAHGPEVVAFEEEFSNYCNTGHGAAVSSGTSAIHLALAALGIGPGDEVVTTSFSFIASASPILFLGAKPVLTDIDPRTFNMDPDSLKEVITSKTRAIVPVHLYGQCADMDAILEAAGDIAVLEDCAQAHGSVYKKRIAGSIGHAGMFSFYPTKNMTTGEGGMVVSDNEEFIEKIRMLRNHGQVARYDHHSIGYNLRMTSIAAAIGRVQLKKLDRRNSNRKQNASILTEGLKDTPGIETPYIEEWNDPVFHQYTVKIEENRDMVSKRLGEMGVGNKVFYPTTISSSPAMREHGGNFPNAEKISKEVLSLPVHPELTREDLEIIIESVKKSLGE
jgi:perosamine synthetase